MKKVSELVSALQRLPQDANICMLNDFDTAKEIADVDELRPGLYFFRESGYWRDDDPGEKASDQ